MNLREQHLFSVMTTVKQFKCNSFMQKHRRIKMMFDHLGFCSFVLLLRITFTFLYRFFNRVLRFWVNCSFKKFPQMDLLIFDDLIVARKPKSFPEFSVLLKVKIRNHGDAAGGWNIVGRQQNQQQRLTLAPLQNLRMKNHKRIIIHL